MTKWLTIPEAAEYLRCSERFLRELLPEGQVPHVMFAGKALFHPDSLDRWLLIMESEAAALSGRPEETGEEAETRLIAGEGNSDEARAIIADFISHEDAFVRRLGENIEQDLEKDDQQLSEKVYAQLSRWCHPRRNSVREREVMPKAQRLSQLLFGKIIERVSTPTYR